MILTEKSTNNYQELYELYDNNGRLLAFGTPTNWTIINWPEFEKVTLATQK